MSTSLTLSQTTLPMNLGAGYEIHVNTGGSLYEILTGTLETLDDSKIPETVTSLRDYLFQNNSLLTSVHLEHITDVGISTFSSCALTDISLPDLETAGMQAFAYNPMVSIVLPSLQAIATQMFQQCDNLVRADFLLANGLGRRAFYDCDNLETLILRVNTVCELDGTQWFYGTKIESGEGYIYVPSSLVTSYQTTTGWSDFASQIRSIDDLTE